jgi:ACS family glucarate transporter-like MFS transporter
MGNDERLGSDAALLHQDPGLLRSSRVRYRVLTAACSVAVLSYIHRLGFALALPGLDLGGEQSSRLAAIFQVAYGGFQVPCGLLGDRLGTRHLLTLLVLSSSLMTASLGLVGLVPKVGLLPVFFLVLIFFLFGMFQAGTFPLLSRMMTDWMPMHERARAQGCIWMASRAGGMVAPHLFAGLVLCLGSWQPALGTLAALGVLWCLSFWPWFRNRPEEMPAVNAAERQRIVAGRSIQPLGRGPAPWSKMLRCRSAWGLCLMYGCVGFAANFYTTLLPTFLVKERHLQDKATNWLSSLPFACGMLMCVGGGVFSDWLIQRSGNRKWGRRLNGFLGLALGALGWLAINWVEEPWALALVLCFIFVCNDLNMAPAWASCADVGERYAGTLGGAMNMIGSLAGAGGNLVAGALFRGGQPQLVFVIYACSFGLASLSWLLIDVTKPLAGQEPLESAAEMPVQPEP